MSRLNINLNKSMILLLKLYKCEDGTLNEIKKQLGSYNDNFLYFVKSDLIKLKILKPIGVVITKKGRGEGELIKYEINKGALNQVFFGDLQTSILREEAMTTYSTLLSKVYTKRNLKNLLSD